MEYEKTVAMFVGQLVLFMIHELECNMNGICQTVEKVRTGMITSIKHQPEIEFFDITDGKEYFASIEDIASVEYLN